MAGDEKDKAKAGEGAGANPGPRKALKVTLANVSMTPIQIKMTRLTEENSSRVLAGQVEPERVISLPPLMVKPKTFTGDEAEFILHSPFVDRLVNATPPVLVIDRVPGMSDPIRASSEPELPEDMKPQLEVNRTVSHVDTINLSTKKLEVSQIPLG
jgi:hypothetical protein